MRKTIFLFNVIFTFSSFSIHANQINHFGQQCEQLIQETIPHANIGIIVQNPQSGKILFEKNAQHYFHPASNTKLLTAIAALKYLGPHFQYQTSLHAALSNIEDSVLKDDLGLVFQGDPTLTISDLFDLLYVIKTKGIKTIQGNIIIDDQAFSGPAYAPGWTWDSLPWYYSAPITSIIINENKTRVKLAATKTLYTPIQITPENPHNLLLSIKTNVKAVSTEDAEHKCRLNAQIKDNAIKLSGCWPMDHTPTAIEFALDNPRKMASDIILHYLSKNQIELKGEIKFNYVNKQIPAIAIKRSLPLKKLLFKVLADSNNIYTESLTKTLGLVYAGEGSFQRGTEAIRKILSTHFSENYTKLPLSDGSGQSRYNLISPYILMQLLNEMYHDPLFLTFYNALSVNGKSGTLTDRMKEKSITGKFVAKTGTATGTSALSGYFTAQDGNQYIFSILINNADKNYYALKTFEDKLCKLLVQETW